jgi:hypothetical protein
MRRAALVIVLLAGAGSLLSADKGPPVNMQALLARLADTVTTYYSRAQSIICDENVRLQSLGFDLMSDQMPARRLLFELRVSWDPPEDGDAPEANVVRTLLRVNNRAPREKDRDACMDPKSVAPDSLAMFLPNNQGDYAFTPAGHGKVDGRPALMIDYRSRQVGPVTASRRDDCFSIELPGRTRGRVWVDEETGDVLRLDERLTGLVDVTLPPDPKRGGVSERVVIERLDSSLVYRRVEFSDPEESVMLPSSKETVTVIRNAGTPRLRTSQTFNNYRRFLTGGRIVQ